ncbi:hypothetical protein MNBD_GAMMA09-3328 [hydrothermal vent metagenome]|uniref:Uncharacterized protein n=1 Tax=hydrothermal vent metagenome TaxID=652676 RepID=A0A3B0YN29_9ZZZZ
MKKYQLTIDNLKPVTFCATNSQIKSRLHSAYIEFKNKHSLSHVLLYVYHPVQGWRQVVDVRGCYRIINNPLKLNYQDLFFAVIHTLAESDLLPTAQQRQKIIEKNRQAERNLNAEIKRHYFHLIKK